MEARNIWIRIQNKEYWDAGSDAVVWWREQRWEVRSAIIGIPVFLLLVWVFMAIGLYTGLFLLPLAIILFSFLAEPDPMPAFVDKLTGWAHTRRQKVAEKDGFYAKWVSRPFYAGLDGSRNVSASIQNRFLHAGITIALQIYFIILTLIVAYVVVSVVIALLLIALTLWVISKVMSDNSGTTVIRRVHVPTREPEPSPEKYMAMFGKDNRIKEGYGGPFADVIATLDGNHIKEGYGGPLANVIATIEDNHIRSGYGGPLSEVLATVVGNQIREGYGGPLATVIGTIEGDHIKSGYGGPLAKVLFTAK